MCEVKDNLKLCFYDEENCETRILPEFIQKLFEEYKSVVNEYKRVSSLYFQEKCRVYDEDELLYHAFMKATQWYKEALNEFNKVETLIKSKQ